MKFRTRLILCFVVPAIMSIAALAVGLWGLFRTESEFDRYIAFYEATSSSLSEMYAQELQSEQALRNVALNPSNSMGYTNLQNAETGYQKASETALLLTQGRSLAAAVRNLQLLHTTQSNIRHRVLELIANKSDDVNKVLITEETPAWRGLRAELLQDIETSRKRSAEVHQITREHAGDVIAAVTALMLLSFATASALGWKMTHTVHRELGDDPSRARDALHRIADGDLSPISGEDRFPNGSVLASLSAMRVSLVELIARVRTAADSIATGSSQIASGNIDLSSRTEQQAASLQETASSMDELTSTVQQNCDNARHASALASDATTITEKGRHVVGEVVTTMTDIRESSSKIAEITGMIEGIAFQTNILALNAAVEAARAGEQGRGFAVVAGEVRSLAQRASNAAKEIRNLITESVKKIHDGSALACDAGTAMEDITHAITRVTDIMAEIATATSEQSRGIEQINQAITQMDEVTQRNAALVEEATAASRSLESQGQLLSKAVAFFRIVDRSDAIEFWAAS